MVLHAIDRLLWLYVIATLCWLISGIERYNTGRFQEEDTEVYCYIDESTSMGLYVYTYTSCNARYVECCGCDVISAFFDQGLLSNYTMLVDTLYHGVQSSLTRTFSTQPTEYVVAM